MHSPDLRTQMDAMEAREALAHSPGLDEIDVRLETGEVVVITSNQDGGIDAQRRLAEAGFPPDSVRQEILAGGPELYEQRTTA
jgi:hypothetical protein